MAKSTMDALAFLRKHLEGEGGSDLLREMIKTFAEELMSAEASAMCGAGYGERSGDRVNSRNGYRTRQFDTRAGSIELAIPKLRRGSYSPEWLLEPRRRAERALVQVVCQCYVEGVSTRAVDDVVKALGMQGISKSQVSEMAKALDEVVDAFRNRPLDGGPYTYVWLDAPVYDTADRVISRTETTNGTSTTTLYFYWGAGGALAEETDGNGDTKVRYLVDTGDEHLARLQQPEALSQKAFRVLLGIIRCSA